MSSSPNKPRNTSATDGGGAYERATLDSDEAVAVPSNTATNNSNNDFSGVKFLRFGVDSLYLSYQGDLFPHVHQKLIELKKLAQSDRADLQAKAQYKINDHLFEVKDKGTSMFGYILEDNAFRIQLSRPNKAVPMAYVKISSEFLTYKTAEDAEKHLYEIIAQLGLAESGANVSRIDLFVDFVSHQNMEAWGREAWVTRASSVTSYAQDNRFTGWSIGLGGVIAARLYNKIYEICQSNKGYLIPLWKEGGWQDGEPVWRLEFEFKREFLTQKNLAKLTYVLANLNGLWSYAMTEWLKLTIPNPEDKTRARWPIHPLWACLSSLDWQTFGGVLKPRFEYDRAPNDKEALNRAFSAVTTWMAANGHTSYERVIHKFFTALDEFILNRAMDNGLTFEQLVEEKVSFKARAFNTIDNNEVQTKKDYGLAERARAYDEASNGE